MINIDLKNLTIEKAHESLKKGEYTCKDLADAYLKNIEEKNKELNAYLEVFEDAAIATAKALDTKRQSGKPIGKLHGVVIALKDVICYKGHKVTAASGILKGFESVYSATAVQRLFFR